MLIIPSVVLDDIKAHSVASYPYEGCGLLLGYVENGVNVVTDVRPLPNLWPVKEEKRTRFRIGADDWQDVEMEAMLDDLDVIGVFHSHPDHPPLASPRDLAWAAWPGYSYLITEIRAGGPGDSRSWQLKSDRSGFVEERIDENYLEMKQ
jgi:proteasome lid subunit RPN8/RPN11